MSSREADTNVKTFSIIIPATNLTIFFYKTISAQMHHYRFVKSKRLIKPRNRLRYFYSYESFFKISNGII